MARRPPVEVSVVLQMPARNLKGSLRIQTLQPRVGELIRVWTLDGPDTVHQNLAIAE